MGGSKKPCCWTDGPRPLSWALIAVLGLLRPDPAIGHDDYEQPLHVSRSAEGQRIEIVSHFTDGMVTSDPVKVRIYGPDRTVLDESRYFRDITSFEDRAGRIHVFGVNGDSVFFEQAWE